MSVPRLPKCELNKILLIVIHQSVTRLLMAQNGLGHHLSQGTESGKFLVCILLIVIFLKEEE